MFSYRIELMIEASREDVVRHYLDHVSMKLWIPGLSHIESTQGKLFETGSQGLFHFSSFEQAMVMKVTVTQSELPDQITLIYEVPGAWNSCENIFNEANDKTRWTMDVIFKFDTDPPATKERFIDQTYQSMKQFKTFMENR